MTSFEAMLLEPSEVVHDPEISIVIPAANESLTIKKFIDWCKVGIEEINVKTEILIICSSDDDTAKIALDNGARVLITEKRGLGQAYIDAIPFIKGKFVIMGDADCTYDFRELSHFYLEFVNGYQYIMGSRFKGFIEKNSMPRLHQFVGTPFTTWILNKIFKTSFSDIHCGMRGITLDALKKMNLISRSWEYASEMIIKAVQFRLKICEVPVSFYKDIDGRQSHHKRSGFLSPYKAAFQNIKSMFIFGSEYIFKSISRVLIISCFPLAIYLSFRKIEIGSIELSYNSALILFFCTLIGLILYFTAFLAQMLHDYGQVQSERIYKNFNSRFSIYTHLFLLVFGLINVITFFTNVVNNNFGRLGFDFISTNGYLYLSSFSIVYSLVYFLFLLLISAFYFRFLKVVK
jgi:glycosyltransferase involved in cell wall biosynthesis